MIKEAISKLIDNKDLTIQETSNVMNEIMSGQATHAQIAGFLTSLRLKGETIDEITGCAIVMREFSTKIEVIHKNVLDTCGTGGDRKSTFNISTMAAIVAAGADAIVAKHGNRSVSSKCGSADLLLELGVNIEVDKKVVQECVNEIGIGFLFAPLLHGAMKYAMPVRRELGIRTIFNILGPLTNPAGAHCQLLGVYDEKLVEPIAHVLMNLGTQHALVVHGMDGLDEVTSTAPTVVSEVKDSKVRNYTIDAVDYKIRRATLDELRGGDTVCNAKMALDVLQGKENAVYDMVVLNAGCSLYACNRAKNIEQGIEQARKAIKSGKALQKLEELKQYTNKTN